MGCFALAHYYNNINTYGLGVLPFQATIESKEFLNQY